MNKAKKARIDQTLVERGFFASRERAQRAIMAGEIRVGDRVFAKAAELIEIDAPISIVQPPQFASRGALKLGGALDFFGVEVKGKTALDIGSSTGGFTDCLLQRGAAKLFAVDVGHGQLAWKLRNDPRVTVMEKVNARFLSREDISEVADLCVIDVSFISLTLILPRAFELIAPEGMILALIKPQFELQRKDVGRGGIVREPALHEKAQQKIVKFVENRREPGILHMHPKTIGLIAHPGKPGVGDLVNSLAAEFARFSMSILLEKETAAVSGQRSEMTIAQLGGKADLLVVVGGDGTILNVTGQLGEASPPIFGINVGSLGFLTCASSPAFREAVECIAKGKMTFSNRALLEVILRDSTEKHKPMIALNDAVFSRGELSRLIRLRTRVNGEALTEFNADGLIIATPTGSTAYSLSAGGPILEPESGVFVITPICPHVLTNRSIIVSEKSVIEVEASEPDYPVYLTVDGREPLRIAKDATVQIRKAKKTMQLAAMPDMSFFSVVRQKLKWSGSNV